MTDYEECLRALLEALDFRDIDDFMDRLCTKENCEKLGKSYAEEVRKLVKKVEGYEAMAVLARRLYDNTFSKREPAPSGCASQLFTAAGFKPMHGDTGASYRVEHTPTHKPDKETT